MPRASVMGIKKKPAMCGLLAALAIALRNPVRTIHQPKKGRLRLF
jgi:hypothetical protein